MKRAVTLCRCLYCNTQTGSYLSSDNVPEIRATVCHGCQYSSVRDEAREIAAGMRPWVRPLSFWVGFFGQKPAAEQLWTVAQAAWDAEQARIIEHNQVVLTGRQPCDWRRTA